MGLRYIFRLAYRGIPPLLDESHAWEPAGRRMWYGHVTNKEEIPVTRLHDRVALLLQIATSCDRMLVVGTRAVRH